MGAEPRAGLERANKGERAGVGALVTAFQGIAMWLGAVVRPLAGYHGRYPGVGEELLNFPSVGAWDGKEILLFAKCPEAGRVKTRLAKDLGDEDALTVYRALLDHTLAVVRSAGATKVLYVDPPERVADAPSWAPGMDVYLPQTHGDLGVRLAQAMAERMQNGAKSLLFLGSDCPQISLDSVLSAFAGLTENDVVLGPSSDGGYYLLGLKKSRSFLFQGIPWSTDQVLEKTLNILKRESLSYILLDTFSDVDTLRDFQRVRHLEPLKNLGIR